MATKIVKKIAQSNVIINAVNTNGRVSGFDINDIKYKFSDSNSVAAYTSAEYNTGMDKLDGKVSWDNLDDVQLAELSNPLVNVKIQIRAVELTYDAGRIISEQPVVILITAVPKNAGMPQFKMQEPVSAGVELNIYYLKITKNGQEMYEIDVEKDIFKVMGNDILQTRRAILDI